MESIDQMDRETDERTAVWLTLVEAIIFKG